MIGERGRFEHRCAGSECAGERGDDCITGAGDIINLARCCFDINWSVVRLQATSFHDRRALLTPHHTRVSRELLSRREVRSVVGVIFGVTHSQCFEVVWRHQRCRAIRIKVAQLWIDQHRNLLVCERQDFAQYARRHDAFVVVGNDKGVGLLQRVFQTLK